MADRDALIALSKKYGKQPSPLATDPYSRNMQFLKSGIETFETRLSPQEEDAFRLWVIENQIPFDPTSPRQQDYDMRGFWKGLVTGDPHATTGINPNDHRLHFTDYWKTPRHQSFSRESKFANEAAPQWQGDQLVGDDGTVYFDETKRR